MNPETLNGEAGRLFDPVTLFGGIGCVLLLSWMIVFILWVRALVAYLNAYREYQQRHGEPYQSPCERNYFARVTLQCLRALFLRLGNKHSKHSPGQMSGVALGGRGAEESQNLSWRARCVGKPLLNLWLVHRARRFFRRHSASGVVPPNDPSSATAAGNGAGAQRKESNEA